MSFFTVYESPRKRDATSTIGGSAQADRLQPAQSPETAIVCFTPKIGVGTTNLLPHFDPRLGTLKAVMIEYSLVGEFIGCATVDGPAAVSGNIQKEVGLALSGPLPTVACRDAISLDFTSYLSAPPPGVEGRTRNIVDEGTGFNFSGSALFLDAGSLSAMIQADPFPLAEFRFGFDDLDIFAAFPEITGRANANIFRAASTLSIAYAYTPIETRDSFLDPSLCALFGVDIEIGGDAA